MALSSTKKESTITLDEYSTFQYMLAPPSIAKATVTQITSFVFYNEPHDGQKKEIEHEVMVRGNITVLNYYCCCLALLPSHFMGMSRWISAEDYQQCQESLGEKKKKLLQPGDTLRRFRYSYYGGFMQVDTRHVFAGHANNGKEQRFRLVEYFECPISPWTIFHVVYALVVSLAAFCFRVYSGYDGNGVPHPLLMFLSLALLHLILASTGVKMF